MSKHNVTLVLGANGNIGQIIAEREAETNYVVGSYRKDDAVTQHLKQHPNINMFEKNFLKNSDCTDIVEFARNKGTINKVYWVVGESWNMGWDNAKLMDFEKSIGVCALPLASIILNLAPELADENNLMRWVALSGTNFIIRNGGSNKPVSGGAKSLSTFYMKSAAGFWAPKQNLFNNVLNGDSKRYKNLHSGDSQTERQELIRSDIPLGKSADPDEIAELLLWLNSDKNTFMTGADIVCDGGRMIYTKNNCVDSANREHTEYY